MSQTLESGSLHEVAVEIGGMPILLRSEDAEFRALLEKRYAGFVRRPSAAPFALDVDVVRPDRQICEEEELEVWNDGGIWRFERGDFQAEWDPEAGRGRLIRCCVLFTA